MADVFISYDREHRAKADSVAAAFKAYGWSVWFDNRLVGGEDWSDAIERELTAARAVVVLWSEASVRSTWVKNESRKGGDRLVPATLDLVQVPLEFDHLQTVDLSGWGGDPAAPEFQKLVAGVARVLNEPPRPVRVNWRSRLRHRHRVFVYGAVALCVVAGAAVVYRQPWAPDRVLLMDSPLPNVVYDRDAATRGQTNATVIADILAELPVVVTKESTDLEWHREAAIRELNPGLIIIHGSAFYSDTNRSDNAGKLLSFLESMRDTETRFLVYTRVSTDELEQAIQQRVPDARRRFRFWQVPGGRDASFRDPATRRRLIQIVKEVLGV